MSQKKDDRDRLTFDLMGLRKRLEAVALEPEQPIGSVLRAASLIGVEVLEVCARLGLSIPKIGKVEEWLKSTSYTKTSQLNVLEAIAPSHKQIIEEIAAEENISTKEVISLFLDVIFRDALQIRESAQIKKRSFMTTLELWVDQGESGETAREFLRAIASNKRVSDASCIKVARELDVEPEEVIRLRNCVRDRQNNAK